MAAARAFDGALQDVLERLQAASSDLDASGEPDAVAEEAAALALRLTGSAQVELALGDQVFTRSTDSRGLDENVTTAELVAGGQVLGTIKVLRAAPYSDFERQALAIFASQAASVIDSAHRRRSSERAERAHDLAVETLLAVSSHAFSGEDQSDFYRRLARTVGELVDARKVLFWRLRDGMLSPVAKGSYGLDAASLARLHPEPCTPDGTDLASQVVYHDIVLRSRKDDGTQFASILDALGVSDAVSVPWRAGDERIGLLAAYEPLGREGFSRDDRWVLERAGLAAGLVTRLWHAQEDLNRSLDRLVKVDAARQLLLKNLTTVVERERKRFVSELHDDALQKLTAAELQVARLAPGKKVDPEGLASLRGLLEETEAALRRIVFDVRPPALEGPDGLAQSIRDRLSMLSANGVSHDLKIDLPSDLSADDRALIFREVAESIANVERHANATHVKVSLTLSGGGVTGVVQDDGQGFDVAQRSNLPGHLGLLALRERALMAGGRYKIESKPGAGTRIEFWIPVQT